MKKIFSIFLVGFLFTFFSCDEEEDVHPEIETVEIIPVSASNFQVKGNIITVGNALVLEYGFVYSTSPVPDVFQSTKAIVGATATTGPFEKSISTGAEVGSVTIFVRAYLTNQKGTVYGAVKEFTIPPLTVESVVPIVARTGDEITITGENFSINPTENEVKFNETIVAEIIETTATTLVVKVPAGVLIPSYSENNRISVTTGGQTVTATENFRVRPTVTDFSPKIGTFGTTITITGSDFYPFLTSVRIGGKDAAASQVTDESVTFNVPPTITSATLTIQLLSGSDIIDVPGNFTIAVPVITSVTPLVGIGGSVVTITGTGFNIGDFIFSYNTVKFGTSTAERFNFSPTEIIAYVPKGLALGNYTVSVFTGVHTVNYGTPFTVVKPTISSFTPTSAIPGTYVTISGANFGVFDPQNSVLFGTEPVEIYSWDETSVTVFIPLGTSSGVVKITLNASGQSVTSTGDFTIL